MENEKTQRSVSENGGADAGSAVGGLLWRCFMTDDAGACSSVHRSQNQANAKL
jgi:hypothetical protein